MEIDKTTITRIREHGEHTYPEECCGFLVGYYDDAGEPQITEAYPAENVRDERSRRYRLSAHDFHTVESAVEARGRAIVGFYHSHPDHPARPSSTDLDEATFPGYAYIIVSVIDGSAHDLRAWSLAADRASFNEEKITIKIQEETHDYA